MHRRAVDLYNLAIPQMAERKDGAVIIVSSIAALKGSAMLGLYGVSNAADTALVGAEEIGGIAVFLASRAAPFITGQTIIADGGVAIAGLP